MTVSAILQLEGIVGGREKVKTIAEEYREKHPEWFGEYRTDRNLSTEHYHPRFVAILKERCVQGKTAPKGWMTANAVYKLEGIVGGDQKIKTIAEEYREKHPEWFGGYWTKSNQHTEHYHSDLVTILKERCAQKEKAPEGWVTVSAILQLEGIVGGREKVKTIAEEYREKHPEWFGEYRTDRNQTTEHYHPDLVKIIKKQLAKKK